MAQQAVVGLPADGTVWHFEAAYVPLFPWALRLIPHATSEVEVRADVLVSVNITEDALLLAFATFAASFASFGAVFALFAFLRLFKLHLLARACRKATARGRKAASSGEPIRARGARSARSA